MRIAIVTPYTLLNLGLKHLLQKYFDTTPILYNEISEFFDNAPEQFDAYILFADTIIGYSDFFLPRKSKIILLASDGSHLPETSMTSLDIHESEESLLEKIQQFIEHLDKQSEILPHELRNSRSPEYKYKHSTQPSKKSNGQIRYQDRIGA